MYEPQHLLDLHDNNAGGGLGGADPNSWLSGDSSPTLRRTHSSLSATATNNVDRDLFKDLVEIVPLVQSLIDQKASSSFTRRGSMTYTKTPSRESFCKKPSEFKGRNGAQSIPTKKHRDRGAKDQNKVNQDGDGFSMFSSKSVLNEQEREELSSLREQLDDLKKKLLEKDELLKSTEISKDQLTSISAELDELKHEVAEKDSLLKSTQLQLSDTKIKLADRQAAVEKLQWESMSSNKKVEQLQGDLYAMEGEISSLMQLFQGLARKDCHPVTEDYDVIPDQWSLLPDIDLMNEMEMQKLEAAREAYIKAVAAAREKQDEDSIAAAVSARLSLQSIVLRNNDTNASKENIYNGFARANETLAH